MNKIFKVIWSKSKQCYVVVSEVAKNNTGKKKIVVASILAGLAMLTSGGVSNVVAVSTIPFTDKPSTALANGTVKNTTTNGVAIGNAAYSESNQSIAIGFRSLASGTAMGGTIQPSVAIGAGAHAEANNTVAIGTVAENRASYGVSLGNQSNVTSGSDYGIAVGYQAKVSAIHGMALGERAASSGQISVAIGANAKAAGANSYAGGFNSASSGASSVALGESATSSGDTSVAIGKNTVASGGDAVSIGASSQATGSDSLALGKNARANNGDTIAIGQDSVANSLNGVALGKTSKATGASATALGPQSTASATLSTAIGMNSVANQEYATAIGGGSQATAVRGVALGTYSKADTASGVSGYDANANRTNKYAGLTGNTLTSSWGAVSIGDGTNTRQMTGLAAGTKDTDAVNVAQLKSVNLAFTGDNSSSGDVNLANSKLAVTGDTTYITTTAANQGITVKGVKKDITVSNGTASANAGMADAKNVAEAINQANADQKITYKANGSTANSVKLSDGLNFTNGSSTVATVGNNGQVTYDLNAATKKSITDSEAAVKRTISLGADSGTRSSQSLNSNNVAFNIKGYTGSYITTAMVGDTLTINTTRGTIQSDASGTASLSGSDGLATAQNVATAINKAKDGSAWNLAVNTGAAQKVAGGAKVTLQNGNNIALTQTGTTITVGTTSQLTADTVTVGSGTNQIVLNGTNGEVSGKIIKTGNSTLNTNGLTISGGPSVTSTGINAGGKEIKGIADATAADSAVSKGQMDTAIANAQTAATSTEKVVAKTLTGDNNLATVTGQTGTAKNETYEVAVSENAVKAVASNAAQDAVKVAGTGLATVSDATVAGVKTYTVNVEEGKLVLDDTTGNVGAAGSTQGTTAGKDGVATTQNVAKAINEAVTKANANNAQALADAEHKFDGDTGTTSVRKHGEVLSVKGGVTTPANLTTGNIGVVSDGAGTLNVRLAKALTGLTSAAYTDGAGNTQIVTGASSTITDGAGKTTSMTKDGLSTTDGKNTTTVAPTGVTATDGTHTVKVEGTGIDAGNTELKHVAAGTAATSAVNKQQMEDAVKAGGTWKVTTNTSATTEVTGGDTVDFINGDNIAITNTGRNITIGTAKTVSFDKVTVGGITIDKTDGINAGGKEIKGIADGTAADSAVSKGQMDTAIANAQTAATSTEKVVAKTLTGDNNLATVTGQTGTAKNETYEVAVSENAVKAVASNAAQDAVKVAGTGLATVSDTTTGGVKTYTVNVEEGKLVLDDATGNVGAAGSTQGTTAGKDGVATTQNVAKAINEAVTKANANNAQALADAEHKFDGDTGTTSVRKHGEVLSIKGGVTTPADLTTGNIGVVSDGAGTLNVRLAKALTGLTSATYTDAAGNTTTVTGGTTTIADAAGNTQTLAPTKSEIKDAAGVSTVTTKDGVTATDAAGNTTALTNGGVSTTDGAGNTTALTKGGLSTTDGTNTTTVTPNGMTATDGTNTVKVEGSGIDAGNTEIKNVAAGTTNTSAVNKKQMDDAINKATGDATHEFGGDDTTVVSRKHGEKLNIKGGASTAAADLTDGNIAVLGDATTGTLNLKLAKVLTGLTSATYTDAAGNTTTVTGGTTTIADAAGNTQTLAPTKSEIKDAAGVSTVTTKDGVTATDAAGNTTALTKGGLSTTDGTNTTTVTPNGMTATDGTNTVKVNGSGIDAGNTEIKNVAAGTTNTSAVNKKQMDDAISKATGDATHEFGGDDTTVVSRKHGEQLNIKGGASTAAADLTDGNIAVLGDATTGTLNLKLAKALTGLTSATYTDAAGNTTTVTGGSTTIADAAGNTQTLAPTKSEIKDNAGVSTVTTKDGVTAKDGNGNSTALTKGGVSTTDGAGNTTALTKGGLSTTDGTNTTTVTPNGMTATDGIHTVKVAGSGIDAGNTEIKNVAAGTTNTSAVNKKQMDDAISKATADATHEFGGDTGNTSVRKHGEVLSIKGGVTDTTKLSDNNIGVVSDGAGTLNVKLAKDLIGLNSATYTDAAGNTTTVTGGTTTITDAAGNTQTLAPTKSEIKDAAGVSTVTTKDGVTAKDAAGNTTALTNGGVSTTDGAGNTTALTKGGLSTTDGTNTTTVTPNGLTATDGTNTVKVNGSGIDAGNTEIKNVADGTTPHSAINKNQLDTAVNRLQNATDNISLNIAGNNGTGNVKLKDQVLHIDGTNGLTTKANGQSLTVGLDDATMSTINNTAALANNAAKKDLSNIDQAGKEVIKDTAAWHVKVNSKAPEIVKGGDTVAFKDGHNITITNTGKDITVATKKEVTFDKVSVGGITIDKQADHISGVSSITGSGSGAPTMTFNAANGSTPSSVSMDSNLDMGGKQINNVAAATRPTDAVNKQQVDQAMKSLAGMADSAAKKYASKAGANAAALAALKPIQYDPLAPTQIMAGIGNYKSQTAVALGVAHYANEDTMFNIGASLDSQDAMLNAGVTHKFGSSAERKDIPDRYKGGPISSIYVMQDEVSALKAQNSEMQAMLDKQSSENAAIIAENKMLREQNEEMQRKVDLILSKLQ